MLRYIEIEDIHTEDIEIEDIEIEDIEIKDIEIKDIEIEDIKCLRWNFEDFKRFGQVFKSFRNRITVVHFQAYDFQVGYGHLVSKDFLLR